MKFRSFYKKLIYIVLLLVVVPSVVYFIVYTVNFNFHLYGSYCTQNDSILKGINLRLEDYINRLETYADFILFDQSLQGSDNKTLNLENRLEYVFKQNEEIESIIFYDTKNQTASIINEKGYNNFSNASDIEMQNWYRSIITTVFPYSIEAQHRHINYDERYNMDKNETVFSFSKKYTVNNQKYVVLINSKNYFLRSICYVALDHREEIIQMLNKYGEVIYSSSENFSVYDRNYIFDYIDLSNEQHGWFKFVSEKDGQEKLVVYVQSMINNNIYFKSIEMNVLSNSVLSGLIQMVLIFIITLIVSIFMVLLISRFFVRTLMDLKKGIDRFALGDLKVKIEVKQNDEIGQIAQSFNKMADSINMLIQDKYELEIFNRTARYYSLIAQINPHFINNVLQTIGAIGLDKDVPEVYEGTILLGKMLRYTIKEEDSVFVKKEINNLYDYLNIQRMRFENKIAWNIMIDKELEKMVIPKFTLQPLVENAMVHGLEKKKGNGYITVLIKKFCNNIVIAIEDNGLGMEGKIKEDIIRNIKENSTEIEKKRIGVVNVIRRMQIMFDNRFSYQIESTKYEGTKIVFTIAEESNNV